ncbi:TBC1 domain family member 22B-like [Mauremys reevesii]|uniref:TBC1 domain family member 22B-like n=1 Tax=Mauremys reevesii TaxID=260615 RepID=UPI00193FA5DB|nr:TBC1 domain family member 22B-like [Mauremys reevesii]
MQLLLGQRTATTLLHQHCLLKPGLSLQMQKVREEAKVSQARRQAQAINDRGRLINKAPEDMPAMHQSWWRTCPPSSIQPVYGAQHPPLDPRITKNFIKERSKGNALPLKNKKASSFHEFARNTSDAWDIGDDEDFSSFQTLNSKVAKATAAQVLENHSKLRVKPEQAQSALSEMPTNCKVIKSSSEAQLSRPPDL